MRSFLSRITLIPAKCSKRFGKFQLATAVFSELQRNGIILRNGDIVVVTSKFVSISEGRYVKLDKVRPRKKARDLSKFYRLDPHLAQLVLDESEEILGGIPGFVLAV